MPPSDPAAVCLCGSPHADWTAYGKLLCARCAANVVVASGSFVAPAAVPPRTSCCQHFSDCAQHNAPAEPVGPCDCGKGGPPCGGEPVPPPEWALDAAHEYFSDQWTHLGIPKGIAVNVSPLARLLASVREGAIHDSIAAVWAASKTGDDPVAFINQLLHTPPSGGAG